MEWVCANIMLILCSESPWESNHSLSNSSILLDSLLQQVLYTTWAGLRVRFLRSNNATDASFQQVFGDCRHSVLVDQPPPGQLGLAIAGMSERNICQMTTMHSIHFRSQYIFGVMTVRSKERVSIRSIACTRFCKIHKSIDNGHTCFLFPRIVHRPLKLPSSIGQLSVAHR